jgi:DNA-binding MarR family transcriptional regulator
VLPLIGADGARVAEIARIQRVSRQAISVTSQDLETLGYLQREPDPHDRRGVVLTLTRRGRRLIADSVAAVAELEASFGEMLGVRRLASLRKVARDLYHALHLEDEIFETRSTERSSASANGAAEAGSSEANMEQLANRLRHRLGSQDAARLAELLGSRARRSMA